MKSACPIKATLILLPIIAIFLVSSVVRGNASVSTKKDPEQHLAIRR